MTVPDQNDILSGLKGLLNSQDLSELQTLGVPSSKLESWRYSSLASFIPTFNFKPAAGVVSAEVEKLFELYPNRVVIRAGKIERDLTHLPNGIDFTEESMAGNSQEKEFVSLLGNALAQNQIQLLVAAKSTFNAPIALIHLPLEAGSARGVSVKIQVQKEVSLELVEFQLPCRENNAAATWSNQSMDIDVAENSTLRHIKLVSSKADDLSLARSTTSLAAHSTYAQTLVILGGKLSREEVEIRLNGEGAHGEIRSLAALKNKEQADLCALLYHAKPHTTSAQLVKNILDHKARGVFTGKIYIEKDAIAVDSSQLSKALLLSKGAQMNTRPQLEIYADDVKAGHGATIGQLSEEELFYLQSRGLSSAKARQMLCHGFGLEILEEIRDEKTKDFIAGLIFDEFEQHTISQPQSEEN